MPEPAWSLELEPLTRSTRCGPSRPKRGVDVRRLKVRAGRDSGVE